MEETKYKIIVVRGAFVDPTLLNKFNPTIIEDYEEGDEWQGLDEITVTLKDIKELQKIMIKHYSGQNNPWYMDGHKEENKNELIVVFGADDGENGKIFQFKRTDIDEIEKVKKYGISKGIPEEQMDFGQLNV
ncbi:MAG: hypothetical protein NTX96_01425 [Candidatus Zambryskibacteria bacterium]|nr:hypothetical protein [Candidatus Zambryskibacteria bacterium]